MRFLDPKQTWEFVLPEDRDLPLPAADADPAARAKVEEENVLRQARRVVFILGVLTVREWASIQDAKFAATGAYQGGTDQRLSVMYGLKGWRGPDGCPAFVKDANGRPTDATLDVLPKRALAPIAEEVAKRNEVLGEEELGKSEGQ